MPRRGFFGQTHPASIYQAKQGWIGTTTQSPEQWRATCDLLGCPELARDPRFATGVARAQAADELDEILIPIFRTKTAEEWFELDDVGLTELLGRAKAVRVTTRSRQSILEESSAPAFERAQSGESPRAP